MATPAEDGPLSNPTDETEEYGALAGHTQGRRPADVYLPRGHNGAPMVFDFSSGDLVMLTKSTRVFLTQGTTAIIEFICSWTPCTK